MTSRLRDKWVLITGASSGFGAAAARAFASEGAKLLLGARRLERLEKVAAESKQAGAGEVHFHFLDVCKTASVNEFVDWSKEKIGAHTAGETGLHVLVNNAGGAHGFETVAEGRDDDWEIMFQSNTLGVLRMVRAALPLLPHQIGRAHV